MPQNVLWRGAWDPAFFISLSLSSLTWKIISLCKSYASSLRYNANKVYSVTHVLNGKLLMFNQGYNKGFIFDLQDLLLKDNKVGF